MMLNNYLLESVLNEGTQGLTYLARNKESKIISALKCFYPEFSNEKRFWETYQAVIGFKFRHNLNALLNVKNFGISDNILCLETEYMLNGSLKNNLSGQKGLTMDAAIELISALGNAIYSIHQEGFIYCTLKPSHILLDESYKPRLALTNITPLGSLYQYIPKVKMTVDESIYFAPEVIAEDTVDQSADVYSLGCIFYELITGKDLYLSKDKIVKPGDLTVFKDSLHRISDNRLRDVVFSSAHPNPQNRMQSVPKFLSILQEYNATTSSTNQTKNNIRISLYEKEKIMTDSNFSPEIEPNNRPKADSLSNDWQNVNQSTRGSQFNKSSQPPPPWTIPQSTPSIHTQQHQPPQIPRQYNQQKPQVSTVPNLQYTGQPSTGHSTHQHVNPPMQQYSHPSNIQAPLTAQKTTEINKGLVIGLIVIIILLTVGIIYLFVRMNNQVRPVLQDAPPISVVSPGTDDTTEMENIFLFTDDVESTSVAMTQTSAESIAKTLEAENKAIEATQQAQAIIDQKATATAQKAIDAQLYEDTEKNLGNSRGYWAIYKKKLSSYYNHKSPYFLTQITESRAKHFILHTIFKNPPLYSKDETWEIGTIFRYTDTNNFFKLNFTSEGDWKLENCFSKSEACNMIQEGTVWVDINPSGKNVLKLIAYGTSGFFYFNGQYVTDLDLSARTDMGFVYVYTLFDIGTARDGYKMEYDSVSLRVIY